MWSNASKLWTSALRHFPVSAQDAVTAAIQQDLAPLGEIAPGQIVQRTITMDGQQLTYRAMGLPNGTVNVGTAFPGTVSLSPEFGPLVRAFPCARR